MSPLKGRVKANLNEEIRNAIVWLERQPGVTSVVKGTATGSRQAKRTVGDVSLVSANGATVTLRAYGSKSVRNLVVHCLPGAERERWMGAIRSGDPFKTLPLTQTRRVETVTLPEQVTPFVMPESVGEAAKLYDVSPELAAHWLERNTKNRDLRNDVVLKYSADMKAGLWYVSPDAIAFDTDEVCINGQHRLWAVLDSGCTVRMAVAFGLKPIVVTVLDDHIKRTLLDAAKVANRPTSASLSTRHSGVAKRMLLSHVATSVTDSRTALARMSRQSQLDFLNRHIQAIDFTVRECFRTKQRGVTIVSVMAPVARAYYTQDRERLKHFAKVVATGLTDYGSEDSAAIVLRNVLVRVERPSDETIYRKTERALKSFLDRERLDRNLFEAAKELFPLPEEQTGGKK